LKKILATQTADLFAGIFVVFLGAFTRIMVAAQWVLALVFRN
jgi:hypothetical protein